MATAFCPRGRHPRISSLAKPQRSLLSFVSSVNCLSRSSRGITTIASIAQCLPAHCADWKAKAFPPLESHSPARFAHRHVKAASSFSTLSHLRLKDDMTASSRSSETAKRDTHLDHDRSAASPEDPAREVTLPDKLSSQEGAEENEAGFGEIRRLLRLALPEARWLALSFFCLLVASSVTMIIPYSIGKILDIASDRGEDDGDSRILGLTLNQYLWSFGGVLTVAAVAHFGSVALLRIIGERVVARLRARLYRQTCSQDARFFDSNTVGDLISRLSSDTIIVGKSITQNLSNGLDSLFVTGTGFAIMVWTSPQLTGLLLLMAPPVAIGTVFYGVVIKNISKAMQKNLGVLTKIAEERLGSIKTAQAFVGEAQEVRRYNTQIRSIFALGRREAMTNATYFSSTQWAGDMAILAVLVVGGGFVKAGALSVGDLTSFMMYTVFAGHGLFGLTTFYSELMKGVGAASRLFELQDKRPQLSNTVGKPVESAQGLIKFNNVHFAYPTRPSAPIFQGLDFEIAPGSNVCVVGSSGGGKSTVGSLLLRFYAPTSGSVTINGLDVSDANVKSLRRRIGIVSQEPVLFSGSVAENIAYGKPHASQSEILDAARRANCTFIDALPNGLDTQVGARGSQLSGGQKQRIAIARALLKDPDILILDEATSALDAESETLVNEAVGDLLRGRTTTISIAHRLSTIQRSDQVIVLNSNGSVAEIGPYAQLAADRKSHFSKLMERQLNAGG